MDLNERFNILAQGVMVAQKSGILTLDEAVEAKNHIDTITRGENLKDSLEALANICGEAQKKGIYTLRDAHIIFTAIDGIDDEIVKFTSEQEKQIPETPQENVSFVDDDDSSESTKKNKKKSK